MPEVNHITGVILDKDTSEGIAGYHIEAIGMWRTGSLNPNRPRSYIKKILGDFISKENGEFAIKVPGGARVRLKNGNVWFRVFNADGVEVLDTADKIEWSLSDPSKIKIKLERDSQVPPPDSDVYSITGRITDKTGNPVSAILIKAYAKLLRKEVFITSSESNVRGQYVLKYNIENYQAKSINLILKLYNSDNELIYKTKIKHNASRHEKIDIQLPFFYRELSEIEDLVNIIEPVLDDDLTLAEIEQNDDHDDIEYLAGKTGLDEAKIAKLAISYRFYADSDVDETLWYALISHNLLGEIQENNIKNQFDIKKLSLLAVDKNNISEALKSSISQRRIPELEENEINELIEACLEYMATLVSEDEENPRFVKFAIEDAGIVEPFRKKKYVRIFNQYREISDGFLEALREDGDFEEDEIQDVRASYEVQKLTNSDFSVVKAIKNEFDVHHSDNIRFLAKMGQEQWINFIKEKNEAGEINIPLETVELPGDIKLKNDELYAKNIEQQFRNAFPTTAFSGRLETAINEGQVSGIQNAEKMNSFLQTQTEFEFFNTAIDDYFEKNSDSLSDYDDDSFRGELKSVQRVFKLSNSFSETDALLANGMHSAQKIYRMGESGFIKKFTRQNGVTKQNAKRIWQRAANAHTAVHTIIADLNEFDSGVLPGVLKSSHPALKNFPNWENLFKAGDLCECSHCNSVLSPAAYYSEILMFLKDRETTANGTTTNLKDLLFARRPDLGYLELNCDNTSTPLPYIDVVCEVLEDMIDSNDENDIELTSLTSISETPNDAITEVRDAFDAAFEDTNTINDDKQKIQLGEELNISRLGLPADDIWIAHSDNVSYLLYKKGNDHFLAKILRNTKVKADELRSYPQYINPRAYKKLSSAVYPMSLPFDLFSEEVRAAFTKSRLERWDLMRTLKGTSSPNNPSDSDIAAEYFSINVNTSLTMDEKRLIILADEDETGQKSIWGVDAADDLFDVVSNVKTFLDKTGLDYNQLLQLLDQTFVNPNNQISIEHQDQSCDTDKKVLRGLDIPCLDRMHRFLRLWRKLEDWSVWQVNLVIMANGVGNGLLDEDFLVQLFYLSMLKQRLGKKASIEQVCALFDVMNTKMPFVDVGKKREMALYQSLFLNKRLMNPINPAFILDEHGQLAGGQISNPDNQTVIMAALRLRAGDLETLISLTTVTTDPSDPSTTNPLIIDDLTIENLSILLRHSWLAKSLKLKIEEWASLLPLLHGGDLDFGTDAEAITYLNKIGGLLDDPKSAYEFIEFFDYLVKTGFKQDELNWIIAVDKTSKSATKEQDAVQFLSTLRHDLKLLQSEYSEAQYDFLSTAQPSSIDQLTTLLRTLLQQLGRSEQTVNDFISILKDEHLQIISVTGLPDAFVFPSAITDLVRIKYNSTDKTFRLIGLLTSDQRTMLLDDSIVGPEANGAAYQQAIESLFSRPRLKLKFFEEKFESELKNLVDTIDFSLLSDDLVNKISYDQERQKLCFAGIMTVEEKAALDALSNNTDYRNAINSLYEQPTTIVPPDARIWLVESDLLVPLRDMDAPEHDNLPANLATAVSEALGYLSNTLLQNLAVQKLSLQMEISESFTRKLLQDYPILPEDLMTNLITTFVDSTGVVNESSLKSTFDGYYWLDRVATIIKAWKITYQDHEKMYPILTNAGLLDFGSLPVDASDNLPDVEKFVRTHRLFAFKDRIPETKTPFLSVLNKLDVAEYADKTEFAEDVEKLNEQWQAGEVEKLIDAFDISYPADFLLVENWERLRKALYYLDNLNAGIESVLMFASPVMTFSHANKIKHLLQAKFGNDAWQTLSTEIQDALRERKRDALVAYILNHQQPDSSPSGKWENANDLYAYYLLDVEMSSCQLTSRFVQGSGSIQLFVQRCMMGLEPDVIVNANGEDGDSGWRWWKWMQKYRVWEANRKVFLWPENWIEPELKKDRSSFFKDFENELLQNEINQENVEKAFINYLQKLNGVAQLEIAGVYQEDDGDNTIIHVFGRTTGAEPHLYYYRRYDYRQWTPWEKVELDIQSDYLIPAVVNQRLFLFWPVFSEIPYEEGNRVAKIPSSDEQGDGQTEMLPAEKLLKIQIAKSEYKNSVWSPKQVSNAYASSDEYTGETDKKNYVFYLVDSSKLEGNVRIIYSGNSLNQSGDYVAPMAGSFVLEGCDGGFSNEDYRNQEKSPYSYAQYFIPDRIEEKAIYLKYIEHLLEFDPRNDFSIKNHGFMQHDQSNGLDPTLKPILLQTPGVFKITMPWQLSYFDNLLLDLPRFDFLSPIYNLLWGNSKPIGVWQTFFYSDNNKTFFVRPLRYKELVNIKEYYPHIKNDISSEIDAIENDITVEISGLNLNLLGEYREELEEWLSNYFSLTKPLSNQQIKKLIIRLIMQFINLLYAMWELIKYSYGKKFHFANYYHPYICDLLSVINNPNKGLNELLSRETQMQVNEFDFFQIYHPTGYVIGDAPLVFSTVDITSIDSFAKTLYLHVDKVSEFIYDNLSSDMRIELNEYYNNSNGNAYSLGVSLAEEISFRILNSPNFYLPENFIEVDLRPRTLAIIDGYSSSDILTRRRINRLLLEDAYPYEISRDWDTYPKEEIDFSPDGAYSSYNWELFFHAPLLIANSLSKNQRFEEARDWYHYIFNPLGLEPPHPGGSPISKYWITKPFFETTHTDYVQQRIDNILLMLAGEESVPGYSSQMKQALEAQVVDWRNNPFEPHRIANYRTVAYQKMVVMKYLDNLIAWGDNLFRQDSMESINEATQLYILAAEILGRKPRKVSSHVKPIVKTFNELEFDIDEDELANPLVEVENLIPVFTYSSGEGGETGLLPMLYYCLPKNDKILSYWDTVADRLYKIRHCMNIEGVRRQLALFEPPIDPGALVKAVAGGVDIGSALSDLNAPLPLYRFNVLLQKANDVCNDLKALGGALLSALEKKDAEELTLLRQSQEIQVLESVTNIKETQLDEATENLQGLKKSKELIQIRRDYYQELEYMNAGEIVAMALSATSLSIDAGVAIAYALAGGLKVVPQFLIGAAGFGGSPTATAETGGRAFGGIAEDAALTLSSISNALSKGASFASTIAGYERRQEEWDHQVNLAEKELEQIKTSIAAAELRISISEKELENHELQIENAKSIDEFMHSKYTNKELYQWQVGQISDVYFQSYKLAYDLAKRAERGFRFELGTKDSKYIKFGYWDSLKKGLLSGEKLQLDLRRLEAAYIEQNRREFELSKDISVGSIDPMALIMLRETGRCIVNLPEEIFDLDFPGHYSRRIKSVSISIPCTVGPYTSVSCTLRLLRNSIRTNTLDGVNGYPRNTDEGVPVSDERFIESNIPVNAIAASNAQTDSGVFELSFRDERYLPFEGAGVISQWSFELFNDLPSNNPDFGKPLRQFDFSTVSDAILHINYTAREDSGVFKNKAITHLREYFSQDESTNSIQLFDIRKEFSDKWHGFLRPAIDGANNVVEIDMGLQLFNTMDANHTLVINKVFILARCTNPGDTAGNYTLSISYLSSGNTVNHDLVLAPVDNYGGLYYAGLPDDETVLGYQLPDQESVTWSLTMTRPGGGILIEDPVTHQMEVEDLYLITGYEWD